MSADTTETRERKILSTENLFISAQNDPFHYEFVLGIACFLVSFIYECCLLNTTCMSSRMLMGQRDVIGNDDVCIWCTKLTARVGKQYHHQCVKAKVSDAVQIHMYMYISTLLLL